MARPYVEQNEKKVMVSVRTKYVLMAQAGNLDLSDYIESLLIQIIKLQDARQNLQDELLKATAKEESQLANSEDDLKQVKEILDASK